MTNALYTDLSNYYDLMCSEIDYTCQSAWVHRLHQLFGNGEKHHIDLACGTGPHIRHFIDFGYQCTGLDINQPMLDIAQSYCPEASFTLGNMSGFQVETPVDLITCFLYSVHYCQSIDMLTQCVKSVHQALKPGGVFCFNTVNKNSIDNAKFEQHTIEHKGSLFTFTSAWHYAGAGEQQTLEIGIEKQTGGEQESWQDHHKMVAITFAQLNEILQPYFEVIVFEHDYNKLVPWNQTSGNAIFACVKI